MKQSIDFISYLPQLRVFAEHEKLNVRNDSSDSVVTPLLYGDGTEEKPYKIHSSYDLRALGIVVAQGFETLDTYYLVDQQATFDFTHLESFYVPIGTHANPFKGNFNGNKKTIHLKINRATDYVGLFGVTGEEGFIQNVTLAGTVTGLSYVGSLAGYNQAKLEFIISDTKVTGEHFIGGLTGYTENELTDISVKGNVTGKTYVGGLIGSTSHAILSYTYAISNVVGESYVAGLIGMAIETEIYESFASGSVKGNTYVSGFVASLDGMITLSYATNNVTGNSYVAGLVATNLGHINDVYHSGLIDGNTFVAGITSINSGVIDKAYYNETLALKHNQKQGPQSAIYHVEDTLTVGHRTLDEMTANFPFGLDESQMDLDAANYYLRNNFDFTQYLPELISFTNHSELVFREIHCLQYLPRFTWKRNQDSPYLIYDGKDMVEIDERVKVGNTFTNKYFKVADGVSVIDLTVSGLNYQPIGSEDTFFNGFFNGNNAIFKIGLDEPSTNNQGIFNTLGVQALVENLIVNGSVRGLSYVGSIAGRSLGTIKNVTNYAQIIGEHNDIGGIVGYNEGTMSNVINFGKVTTEGSFVGGIAGQNYHNISDAYNKEMVTGFGNVGGISGVNHGYITNTYNMSNITATKNIAGGIAGSSFGDITYSFNHGNIKHLIVSQVVLLEYFKMHPLMAHTIVEKLLHY